MYKKISLVISIITISISAMAQSVLTKQDLSIFPEPEKGYKKLVIEVPHSSNDSNKKIDFHVGKWMDVDGCNYFNLQGTYEKKDLKGWGFDYYVFKTDGNVMSTMIGCPDAKSRHLFVTAQTQTVNYNGQLPIVIYVPEEYDVQFKIFSTDGDIYRAAEIPYKKNK